MTENDSIILIDRADACRRVFEELILLHPIVAADRILRSDATRILNQIEELARAVAGMAP